MEYDEWSEEYDTSLLTSFLPTTAAGWTIVLSSLTITVLFIIAAYLGGQQEWYIKLIHDEPNAWIIAALWLFFSFISYGAFYFIRDADETIYGQSRLFPLFLIISYLNLLWIVIFYLYQNFIAALLIIGLIIALYVYIIVFLWKINAWAAIFMLPLEALYVYLFYSLIHLAGINKIII